MYNAVFSALMTLTGLTFAALGLLLEGRERHWIRHAKVWDALRFRSLLAVAVFVIATSTLILSRIDSNDEAYTRWWLLTIVLFVCSLVALAHTLVRTRRLVEPTAILERLRRHHFDQHTIVKSPEKSVDAYMEHIKELLVGTLGEGDTNNYRSTHQNGLVNPSSPPEGLEDCVPFSFPDEQRISAMGLLAVDALGEAKAQFDAGSDDRTVNTICADTMLAILKAWAALDVVAINDAAHRQAAEVARENVVRKGCGVVVRCLEAALGTSNPSKSLVEKLEETLRVALPLVGGAPELDAVVRVAQAAERAISSGFTEEASGPLEVVLARVIAARGKRRSELLAPTIKCIPALLAARNSLSINFDDLFRLIVDDHNSMVTMLAEIQKMDAHSCLSILEQLYSQDGVTRRDQVLQAFFIEWIPNSFDQSGDAADHIAAWLQPVADHLALTRPANLKPLREHVIVALRQRFAHDAQVNPIFLMGISAMVKAERRAMSDKEAMANQAVQFTSAGSPAGTGAAVPDGTLSNADHARRHQATTGSRVPASPMLWDCLNIMRDGARFARQSSLSLEFSAEVRRSVMGSLSFVVHEIDDGSVEDLSGFLFDRRLVGAMETVFDLGVLDLGNVSLYLDRFSSAAQTAVELDVGDNPEARNLRNRWNAVRLLCEAAYFDTGCGRPPAELADSGSPEDEQVRTGSSDVVDAGVNEVIAGLVDSIRSVKFPAKRSATGRPLGTMVSDALKVSMFLRTKPTRANPEIDLWAAMDELDDGSHGATAERTVARQLCGSLLAELTRDLLPTWATSLSAECERALAAEDVESAFVLLRTVRSCLKRVNGSRERITISGRGPFYVFNDRTLKDAELLRAGSNIMKAMIEDWIRSGINEFRQGIPTREELETSSNGVINWVSEAMRQNLKHVPGWEVADSELWELGTRMCALAGASETT